MALEVGSRKRFEGNHGKATHAFSPSLLEGSSELSSVCINKDFFLQNSLGSYHLGGTFLKLVGIN